MGFADKLKKLNAQRLQQSVKATVQSNGRLTFTVEAAKVMALSEDKSLVVFEAENGDLGATISERGDSNAFVLKQSGGYFFVSFKNYLQQAGIDYKNQRIIYDITELDEELEGRTLYKFERRVLPKHPKPLPETKPEDLDDVEPPEIQTDSSETDMVDLEEYAAQKAATAAQAAEVTDAKDDAPKAAEAPTEASAAETAAKPAHVSLDDIEI